MLKGSFLAGGLLTGWFTSEGYSRAPSWATKLLDRMSDPSTTTVYMLGHSQSFECSAAVHAAASSGLKMWDAQQAEPLINVGKRVKLQTWPTPYPSPQKSPDVHQSRNTLWQKWGGHVHPSPPRGDTPASWTREWDVDWDGHIHPSPPRGYAPASWTREWDVDCGGHVHHSPPRGDTPAAVRAG